MKIIDTEKIKQARINSGYSQRKLAKIIGMHHSTFNDIESGKNSNPNLVSLIKICKCLKIDLRRIVEWNEEFLMIDNYFYNLYNRGVI